MQERREGGEGTSAPVRPPVLAPCLSRSKYSLSCCSAKFLKLSTMIPALLQSYLQHCKIKPSKNQAQEHLHIDAGASHPALQVIDGQRDVLGVGPEIVFFNSARDLLDTKPTC